MKETLESKISKANNLLDVLMILKEKTMLDTNVSSLAYVGEKIKEFNGKYGVYEVRPFPLDPDRSEYSLQAYYFDKTLNSIDKNTIVLIVFTNRNFIANLEVVNHSSKNTIDNDLHSYKYGVIVPVNMYAKGFDKNKTQVLKNINGTIQWVEE